MSLPIVTPSPLPALMPGAEAAAEVAAEDTIAAVATEAPLATPEMTEKEETEAYQKSMEFIFEVVLALIPLGMIIFEVLLLSFVGVLGIVGNLVLIVLFSFQKVQVSPAPTYRYIQHTTRRIRSVDCSRRDIRA